MNGRECIWRGLADAQETRSGLTVVDELSAASGVCLANQRTDEMHFPGPTLAPWSFFLATSSTIPTELNLVEGVDPG